MKLEMQNNEFDGKLITFFGLDGCGKTTQIKHLVAWLENNGHKVYLTKQPLDFVRNSEIFRTYMDSPTHDAFDYRALSLLCASDSVQHSKRVISQKLKEGYIVISADTTILALRILSPGRLRMTCGYMKSQSQFESLT